MPSFPSTKDRWIVAGLIAGGWTLVILGSAGHDFLYERMLNGGTRSFLSSAMWPGIYWYAWAVLTPVVFKMSSRFRLTGRLWYRNLALLILGCAVVYALHVSLQLIAMALPYYEGLHPTWSDAVSFHVFSSIETNVVVFWVIVGAWYVGDYYRTSRAQEVRNANLESQLARAELQALKMQIHPHFLFNTLHGIAETMYRDVPSADRMLADLSDLLRTSVERTDDAFIPLEDEIAFIQKYLGIEQARFRDRLAIEVTVDEAASDVFVPSFVLQPFVENAVKHGVSTHSCPALVAVRACIADGQLNLTVSDTRGSAASERISIPEENRPDVNGSDSVRKASMPASTGVGIENVARRLDRLFGEDYEMHLSEGDAGFTADLRLPIKHDAALPV